MPQVFTEIAFWSPTRRKINNGVKNRRIRFDVIKVVCPEGQYISITYVFKFNYKYTVIGFVDKKLNNKLFFIGVFKSSGFFFSLIKFVYLVYWLFSIAVCRQD